MIIQKFVEQVDGRSLQERDRKRHCIVFMQMLVILTGFAIVLYPTYNCDYISFYYHFFEGARTGSFWDWLIYRIGEGRPLALLLYFVNAAAGLLHIPYEGYYGVIQLVGLVFTSLSEYLVFSMFSKEHRENKQILIALAVLIGFLNPYLTESFLFIDPNHGQAMLFMSLALICMFSEKRVKQTVLSVLFLFLSISTYQSYYAGFLIYGVCYTYVCHRGKKEYLKVIIVAGCASFLNLVLSQTATFFLGIENRRQVALMGSSIDSLVHRLLRPLLSYGKAILFSYYTIPAGIFAVMALVGIIAVLLREKSDPRRRYGWSALALIWTAPIAYAFVQDSYYTAPRILTPVFMSLSATWLILFLGDEQEEMSGLRLYRIALIAYLGLCVIGVNMTMVKAIKTNGIEIAGVHAIHDRITAYEKNSGEHVDAIAVYKMNGALQRFNKANGLGPTGGVLAEFLGSEWSDVNSINYFNKADYERRVMDEDTFRTLFEGLAPSDLDHIDVEKQLKIVGHTAYWVTYAYE